MDLQSIACWVILWMRPDYRVLGGFVIGFGLFGFFTGVLPTPLPQQPQAFAALLIWLAVMLVVGIGIVALRTRMKARKRIDPNEVTLDAEMERIRADIAARAERP